MKRKLVLLLVILFMTSLLAACGEESVDDVLQSLNKQAEETNSFKATVNMSMNTGEENQNYDVEVWHKKDDFYKVIMHNTNDDKGNQIILRNEEGVFVLTPSINKSYKFQNDWPRNHSQPYLFTSLVDDINQDSEREFKKTENYYVFKVQTNYKGNQQLPTQEIYFHRKTYDPALVKVFNAEGEKKVEVDFTEYEENPTIEDGEFDTERNLAEGAISVPTISELEAEEEFSVYYPFTTPEGTSLDTEEFVDFEEGERVILSFEGSKPFTIIQEKYDSYPTNLTVPVYASGEMVDLGVTVGLMDNHSLEWQQDGMKFVLASDSLTVDEMVEVAKSVQSNSMK
ncbi:DUF4367 domain-containing protein [Halalkalibacillus sediminis]|uniref:DUF4367 domain-containing protein n=1 Tax=Halalkalibacillus sediminis TaxID=2018042 RepID=A0A2I0QRR0_9BACI|nr:outer membrane lipoprotein carrier protein LolA [Halalkalibacillus sediminis]PKR77013.1 DUF4367 domain-containing protein [Halalkalibacillus sediminis]